MFILATEAAAWEMVAAGLEDGGDGLGGGGDAVVVVGTGVEAGARVRRGQGN